MVAINTSPLNCPVSGCRGLLIEEKQSVGGYRFYKCLKCSKRWIHNTRANEWVCQKN